MLTKRSAASGDENAVFFSEHVRGKCACALRIDQFVHEAGHYSTVSLFKYKFNSKRSNFGFASHVNYLFIFVVVIVVGCGSVSFFATFDPAEPCRWATYKTELSPSVFLNEENKLRKTYTAGSLFFSRNFQQRL